MTATVDDQDRLLSYGGASYAYTAHGDLLRKVVGTDTTRYTYDALGNLTDVVLPDGTAIGYLIDAQNRRIGRTVNGVLQRAWLYAITFANGYTLNVLNGFNLKTRFRKFRNADAAAAFAIVAPRAM